MDFLKVIPLAVVMIAGPQIITAFFFATSDSWKRISAAYVLGAALAIPLVVAAGYLFTHGAGQAGESSGSGLSMLDYVLVALLLLAAYHNFANRNDSEPPEWMGKLQHATPRSAFVLGFLLLGLFPSDLVTSVSIGGYLAGQGDPYLEALPFVVAALGLLALPALLVLTLGSRAQTVLPAMRGWMDRNSWIISEFVIVLFIAIILSG